MSKEGMNGFQIGADAARRMEEEYGKDNLGPYTDFEWGMIHGASFLPFAGFSATNGTCWIRRGASPTSGQMVQLSNGLSHKPGQTVNFLPAGGARLFDLSGDAG